MQLPIWWLCSIGLLSMIICLESPIAGNRTSTFLLNYICFSDRSSDHVDLPTFTVVTEVGKGFFCIEDITTEGISEISHSFFNPLVYKCFGPITWGMTSWLFSSCRSQHATGFLVCLEYTEDHLKTHLFVLPESHSFNAHLLVHFFPPLLLFYTYNWFLLFPLFPFKFVNRPENSTTGKTVS